MTNLSTRWLLANFTPKFVAQVSNFLQLKLKHNFIGVERAEMINDYYLVCVESDRLASRLTVNEDGKVVALAGKGITPSRMALYVFNTFLDTLDKSMRKNVDIAQMWAFSDSDDDQSYLRWYNAPPSDHYEAVSNVDDAGNVSKDIADRGVDMDSIADQLSSVEADAVLGLMGNLTRLFMKGGRPIPKAKEAVYAELTGMTSTEFAQQLGINRGNAKEKMNIARKAIDYWADTHRQCLAILVRLKNGGGIGDNANFELVELMQQKGLISRTGEITEKGLIMSDLPTRPSIFRESISYWLLK